MAVQLMGVTVDAVESLWGDLDDGAVGVRHGGEEARRREGDEARQQVAPSCWKKACQNKTVKATTTVGSSSVLSAAATAMTMEMAIAMAMAMSSVMGDMA